MWHSGEARRLQAALSSVAWRRCISAVVWWHRWHIWVPARRDTEHLAPADAAVVRGTHDQQSHAGTPRNPEPGRRAAVYPGRARRTCSIAGSGRVKYVLVPGGRPYADPLEPGLHQVRERMPSIPHPPVSISCSEQAACHDLARDDSSNLAVRRPRAPVGAAIPAPTIWSLGLTG